jgi:hypothetical protein
MQRRLQYSLLKSSFHLYIPPPKRHFPSRKEAVNPQIFPQNQQIRIRPFRYAALAPHLIQKDCRGRGQKLQGFF